MKIVLDNNIVFSLMDPNSSNSRLFFGLDVEFIAPDFLIEEFDKYEAEAFRKSGLSWKGFQARK